MIDGGPDVVLCKAIPQVTHLVCVPSQATCYKSVNIIACDIQINSYTVSKKDLQDIMPTLLGFAEKLKNSVNTDVLND